MLAYQIGWSLDPQYISFADNLNSFIGNCFYDDSLWTLQLSSMGWQASPERDECNCSQDPIVLIDAARENRQYFDKIEQLEKENPTEIMIMIRNPFESKAISLIPFTKNPKYVYPVK